MNDQTPSAARSASSPRDTIISEGVSIEGRVVVKDGAPVVVLGTVNGDIVSDGSVTVEPSGVVNGTIEARHVDIAGLVDATGRELQVKGLFHMRKTGVLNAATVFYDDLDLDRGVRISCGMQWSEVPQSEKDRPVEMPSHRVQPAAPVAVAAIAHAPTPAPAQAPAPVRAPAPAEAAATAPTLTVLATPATVNVAQDRPVSAAPAVTAVLRQPSVERPEAGILPVRPPILSRVDVMPARTAPVVAAAPVHAASSGAHAPTPMAPTLTRLAPAPTQTRSYQDTMPAPFDPLESMSGSSTDRSLNLDPGNFPSLRTAHDPI